MKVLVTGGAGFIGSHLVERLAQAGDAVRVLDNLSTGNPGNLSGAGRAVELIEGDVRDRRAVSDCLDGMDAVVHLAAVASVQASIDDPVGTHGTNFDGTLNLLEAARALGVRRLVYASSAAVYGDPEQLPVAEEARPRPLSPYAADKLAGEYYLQYYAARYGLEGTAFRFFNIYGPRQDPSSPYSGVISIFTDRLRTGTPVTVFGQGDQTRDFVYVGDLAGLLVEALRRPTGAAVLNVGTGRPSTLLDLLNALEGLTGRRLERRFEPRRAGDILHSCAEVMRLQQAFGRIVATPLREGLEALLRYEGIGLRGD